ncbi:hypothetical protein Btru_023289 [Bulinus truncatus]|nr:hypothetical protein Btru_023289 [Bulinus truncatus]
MKETGRRGSPSDAVAGATCRSQATLQSSTADRRDTRSRSRLRGDASDVGAKAVFNLSWSCQSRTPGYLQDNTGMKNEANVTSSAQPSSLPKKHIEDRPCAQNSINLRTKINSPRRSKIPTRKQTFTGEFGPVTNTNVKQSQGKGSSDARASANVETAARHFVSNLSSIDRKSIAASINPKTHLQYHDSLAYKFNHNASQVRQVKESGHHGDFHSQLKAQPPKKFIQSASENLSRQSAQVGFGQHLGCKVETRMEEEGKTVIKSHLNQCKAVYNAREVNINDRNPKMTDVRRAVAGAVATTRAVNPRAANLKISEARSKQDNAGSQMLVTFQSPAKTGEMDALRRRAVGGDESSERRSWACSESSASYYTSTVSSETSLASNKTDRYSSTSKMSADFASAMNSKKESKPPVFCLTSQTSSWDDTTSRVPSLLVKNARRLSRKSRNIHHHHHHRIYRVQSSSSERVSPVFSAGSNMFASPPCPRGSEENESSLSTMRSIPELPYNYPSSDEQNNVAHALKGSKVRNPVYGCMRSFVNGKTDCNFSNRQLLRTLSEPNMTTSSVSRTLTRTTKSFTVIVSQSTWDSATNSAHFSSFVGSSSETFTTCRTKNPRGRCHRDNASPGSLAELENVKKVSNRNMAKTPISAKGLIGANNSRINRAHDAAKAKCNAIRYSPQSAATARKSRAFNCKKYTMAKHVKHAVSIDRTPEQRDNGKGARKFSRPAYYSRRTPKRVKPAANAKDSPRTFMGFASLLNFWESRDGFGIASAIQKMFGGFRETNAGAPAEDGRAPPESESDVTTFHSANDTKRFDERLQVDELLPRESAVNIWKSAERRDFILPASHANAISDYSTHRAKKERARKGVVLSRTSAGEMKISKTDGSKVIRTKLFPDSPRGKRSRRAAPKPANQRHVCPETGIDASSTYVTDGHKAGKTRAGRPRAVKPNECKSASPTYRDSIEFKEFPSNTRSSKKMVAEIKSKINNGDIRTINSGRCGAESHAEKGSVSLETWKDTSENVKGRNAVASDAKGKGDNSYTNTLNIANKNFPDKNKQPEVVGLDSRSTRVVDLVNYENSARVSGVPLTCQKTVIPGSESDVAEELLARGDASSVCLVNRSEKAEASKLWNNSLAMCQSGIKNMPQVTTSKTVLTVEQPHRAEENTIPLDGIKTCEAQCPDSEKYLRRFKEIACHRRLRRKHRRRGSATRRADRRDKMKAVGLTSPMATEVWRSDDAGCSQLKQSDSDEKQREMRQANDHLQRRFDDCRDKEGHVLQSERGKDERVYSMGQHTTREAGESLTFEGGRRRHGDDDKVALMNCYIHEARSTNHEKLASERKPPVHSSTYKQRETGENVTGDHLLNSHLPAKPTCHYSNEESQSASQNPASLAEAAVHTKPKMSSGNLSRHWNNEHDLSSIVQRLTKQKGFKLNGGWTHRGDATPAFPGPRVDQNTADAPTTSSGSARANYSTLDQYKSLGKNDVLCPLDSQGTGCSENYSHRLDHLTLLKTDRVTDLSTCQEAAIVVDSASFTECRAGACPMILKNKDVKIEFGRSVEGNNDPTIQSMMMSIEFTTDKKDADESSGQCFRKQSSPLNKWTGQCQEIPDLPDVPSPQFAKVEIYSAEVRSKESLANDDVKRVTKVNTLERPSSVSIQIDFLNVEGDKTRTAHTCSDQYAKEKTNSTSVLQTDDPTSEEYQLVHAECQCPSMEGCPLNDQPLSSTLSIRDDGELMDRSCQCPSAAGRRGEVSRESSLCEQVGIKKEMSPPTGNTPRQRKRRTSYTGIDSPPKKQPPDEAKASSDILVKDLYVLLLQKYMCQGQPTVSPSNYRGREMHLQLNKKDEEYRETLQKLFSFFEDSLIRDDKDFVYSPQPEGKLHMPPAVLSEIIERANSAKTSPAREISNPASQQIESSPRVKRELSRHSHRHSADVDKEKQLGLTGMSGAHQNPLIAMEDRQIKMTLEKDLLCADVKCVEKSLESFRAMEIAYVLDQLSFKKTDPKCCGDTCLVDSEKKVSGIHDRGVELVQRSFINVCKVDVSPVLVDADDNARPFYQRQGSALADKMETLGAASPRGKICEFDTEKNRYRILTAEAGVSQLIESQGPQISRYVDAKHEETIEETSRVRKEYQPLLKVGSSPTSSTVNPAERKKELKGCALQKPLPLFRHFQSFSDTMSECATSIVHKMSETDTGLSEASRPKLEDEVGVDVEYVISTGLDYNSDSSGKSIDVSAVNDKSSTSTARCSICGHSTADASSGHCAACKHVDTLRQHQSNDHSVLRRCDGELHLATVSRRPAFKGVERKTHELSDDRAAGFKIDHTDIVLGVNERGLVKQRSGTGRDGSRRRTDETSAGDHDKLVGTDIVTKGTNFTRAPDMNATAIRGGKNRSPVLREARYLTRSTELSTCPSFPCELTTSDKWVKPQGDDNIDETAISVLLENRRLEDHKQVSRDNAGRGFVMNRNRFIMTSTSISSEPLTPARDNLVHPIQSRSGQDTKNKRRSQYTSSHMELPVVGGSPSFIINCSKTCLSTTEELSENYFNIKPRGEEEETRSAQYHVNANLDYGYGFSAGPPPDEISKLKFNDRKTANVKRSKTMDEQPKIERVRKSTPEPETWSGEKFNSDHRPPHRQKQRAPSSRRHKSLCRTSMDDQGFEKNVPEQFSNKRRRHATGDREDRTSDKQFVRTDRDIYPSGKFKADRVNPSEGEIDAKHFEFIQPDGPVSGDKRGAKNTILLEMQQTKGVIPVVVKKTHRQKPLILETTFPNRSILREDCLPKAFTSKLPQFSSAELELRLEGTLKSTKQNNTRKHREISDWTVSPITVAPSESGDKKHNEQTKRWMSVSSVPADSVHNQPYLFRRMSFNKQDRMSVGSRRLTMTEDREGNVEELGRKGKIAPRNSAPPMYLNKVADAETDQRIKRMDTDFDLNSSNMRDGFTAEKNKGGGLDSNESKKKLVKLHLVRRRHLKRREKRRENHEQTLGSCELTEMSHQQVNSQSVSQHRAGAKKKRSPNHARCHKSKRKSRGGLLKLKEDEKFGVSEVKLVPEIKEGSVADSLGRYRDVEIILGKDIPYEKFATSFVSGIHHQLNHTQSEDNDPLKCEVQLVIDKIFGNATGEQRHAATKSFTSGAPRWSSSQEERLHGRLSEPELGDQLSQTVASKDCTAVDLNTCSSHAAACKDHCRRAHGCKKSNHRQIPENDPSRPPAMARTLVETDIGDGPAKQFAAERHHGQSRCKPNSVLNKGNSIAATKTNRQQCLDKPRWHEGYFKASKSASDSIISVTSPSLHKAPRHLPHVIAKGKRVQEKHHPSDLHRESSSSVSTKMSRVSDTTLTKHPQGEGRKTMDTTTKFLNGKANGAAFVRKFPVEIFTVNKPNDYKLDKITKVNNTLTNTIASPFYVQNIIKGKESRNQVYLDVKQDSARKIKVEENELKQKHFSNKQRVEVAREKMEVRRGKNEEAWGKIEIARGKISRTNLDDGLAEDDPAFDHARRHDGKMTRGLSSVRSHNVSASKLNKRLYDVLLEKEGAGSDAAHDVSLGSKYTLPPHDGQIFIKGGQRRDKIMSGQKYRKAVEKLERAPPARRGHVSALARVAESTTSSCGRTTGDSGTLVTSSELPSLPEGQPRQDIFISGRKAEIKERSDETSSNLFGDGLVCSTELKCHDDMTCQDHSTTSKVSDLDKEELPHQKEKPRDPQSQRRDSNSPDPLIAARLDLSQDKVNQITQIIQDILSQSNFRSQFNTCEKNGGAPTALTAEQQPPFSVGDTRSKETVNKTDSQSAEQRSDPLVDSEATTHRLDETRTAGTCLEPVAITSPQRAVAEPEAASPVSDIPQVGPHIKKEPTVADASAQQVLAHGSSPPKSSDTGGKSLKENERKGSLCRDAPTTRYLQMADINNVTYDPSQETHLSHHGGIEIQSADSAIDRNRDEAVCQRANAKSDDRTKPDALEAEATSSPVADSEIRVTDAEEPEATGIHVPREFKLKAPCSFYTAASNVSVTLDTFTKLGEQKQCVKLTVPRMGAAPQYDVIVEADSEDGGPPKIVAEEGYIHVSFQKISKPGVTEDEPAIIPVKKHHPGEERKDCNDAEITEDESRHSWGSPQGHQVNDKTGSAPRIYLGPCSMQRETVPPPCSAEPAGSNNSKSVYGSLPFHRQSRRSDTHTSPPFPVLQSEKRSELVGHTRPHVSRTAVDNADRMNLAGRCGTGKQSRHDEKLPEYAAKNVGHDDSFSSRGTKAGRSRASADTPLSTSPHSTGNEPTALKNYLRQQQQQQEVESATKHASYSSFSPVQASRPDPLTHKQLYPESANVSACVSREYPDPSLKTVNRPVQEQREYQTIGNTGEAVFGRSYVKSSADRFKTLNNIEDRNAVIRGDTEWSKIIDTKADRVKMMNTVTGESKPVTSGIDKHRTYDALSRNILNRSKAMDEDIDRSFNIEADHGRLHLNETSKVRDSSIDMVRSRDVGIDKVRFRDSGIDRVLIRDSGKDNAEVRPRIRDSVIERAHIRDTGVERTYVRDSVIERPLSRDASSDRSNLRDNDDDMTLLRDRLLTRGTSNDRSYRNDNIDGRPSLVDSFIGIHRTFKKRESITDRFFERDSIVNRGERTERQSALNGVGVNKLRESSTPVTFRNTFAPCPEQTYSPGKLTCQSRRGGASEHSLTSDNSQSDFSQSLVESQRTQSRFSLAIRMNLTPKSKLNLQREVSVEPYMSSSYEGDTTEKSHHLTRPSLDQRKTKTEFWKRPFSNQEPPRGDRLNAAAKTRLTAPHGTSTQPYRDSYVLDREPASFTGNRDARNYPTDVSFRRDNATNGSQVADNNGPRRFFYTSLPSPDKKRRPPLRNESSLSDEVSESETQHSGGPRMEVTKFLSRAWADNNYKEHRSLKRDSSGDSVTSDDYVSFAEEASSLSLAGKSSEDFFKQKQFTAETSTDDLLSDGFNKGRMSIKKKEQHVLSKLVDTKPRHNTGQSQSSSHSDRYLSSEHLSVGSDNSRQFFERPKDLQANAVFARKKRALISIGTPTVKIQSHGPYQDMAKEVSNVASAPRMLRRFDQDIAKFNFEPLRPREEDSPMSRGTTDYSSEDVSPRMPPPKMYKINAPLRETPLHQTDSEENTTSNSDKGSSDASEIDLPSRLSPSSLGIKHTECMESIISRVGDSKAARSSESPRDGPLDRFKSVNTCELSSPSPTESERNSPSPRHTPHSSLASSKSPRAGQYRVRFSDEVQQFNIPNPETDVKCAQREPHADGPQEECLAPPTRPPHQPREVLLFPKADAKKIQVSDIGPFRDGDYSQGKPWRTGGQIIYKTGDAKQGQRPPGREAAPPHHQQQPPEEDHVTAAETCAPSKPAEPAKRHARNSLWVVDPNYSHSNLNMTSGDSCQGHEPPDSGYSGLSTPNEFSAVSEWDIAIQKKLAMRREQLRVKPSPRKVSYIRKL